MEGGAGCARNEGAESREQGTGSIEQRTGSGEQRVGAREPGSKESGVNLHKS